MDVREFYERMLGLGRRLARDRGLTGEAADRYARTYARDFEPVPDAAGDPWEAAVSRMESIMRLSGQDYGGGARLRAAAELAMAGSGESVGRARESWRAGAAPRGGGAAGGGSSSLASARAACEAVLTQAGGLSAAEAIRLVEARMGAGVSGLDGWRARLDAARGASGVETLRRWMQLGLL